MAATGRYTRVIKYVKEAEELAHSGALILDDGVAAIYFLWGQPSHAFIRVGEEMIEGEPALKEIALSLDQPGKVAWRSKDVLQLQTLRCSGEDLMNILKSIAKAPKAPPAASPSVPLMAEDTADWDGIERRQGGGLVYDLVHFPLLPVGAALWADVPTSVVHLDVLVSSLPTVLIIFEGEGVRAAGIVLRGELFDALHVTADASLRGREAWTEILSPPHGTVSAYEIHDELAEALPVLWRSQVVLRDMDKRWLDGGEFLEGQRASLEDRAILVTSKSEMGVAVFLRGKVAGVYTTSNRMAQYSLDPLIALFNQPGEGKVLVVERLADDVGEPFTVAPLTEAPMAEPEGDTALAAWALPPAEVAPLVEPATTAAAEFAAAPELAPPLGGEMVFERYGGGLLESEPAPEPQSQSAPGGFGEPEGGAPQVLEAPTVMPWIPSLLEDPAPGPAPAPLLQFGHPTSPGASAEDVEAADPAAAGSEWAAPPPPPYMGPSLVPDVAADHPDASEDPPPVDYEAILGELMAIGERFLGDDFGAVRPLLMSSPHSPQGIREVLLEIRRTEVPGRTPDEVTAMARAMVLFVADRVTAA